MNEFKLCKASWHYRLNTFIWEGNITNRSYFSLCEYFWKTVVTVSVFTVGFSALLFLVGMLIWTVYLYPLESAKGLAFLLGVFTVAASVSYGIICVQRWSRNRRNRTYYIRRVHHEPSLIEARYQAWKDKVCPILKVED